MLAAAVSKTGGAEVIQQVQVPVPSPAKGQVLVQQAATSVNPIGELHSLAELATPNTHRKSV